jgi:hypothetical protein
MLLLYYFNEIQAHHIILMITKDTKKIYDKYKTKTNTITNTNTKICHIIDGVTGYLVN